MSSMKGIDHLNKELADYLEDHPEAMFLKGGGSVIGDMMHNFRNRGTRHWETASPEYFLVYLFTEIGATPHNIRDGRQSISILTAFQHAVQNLKHRRFEEWQPDKTKQLVRDFLICMDELKALSMVFTNKVQFFQKLSKDVEAQHAPMDPTRAISAESEIHYAKDRIDWVLKLLERQLSDTQSLYQDISQAMDSVRYPNNCCLRDTALTIHSCTKSAPWNRVSLPLLLTNSTKPFWSSQGSRWSFCHSHSSHPTMG